jgi:hypothetical protein
MSEYVYLLLLPVAVYFGWWLARTLEKRSTNKKKQLFSNQYFQGLNYLLNEQPDKAIQVFLELAEVNQDAEARSIAPSDSTRISSPSRAWSLNREPRPCLRWEKIICVPACWTGRSGCLPNSLKAIPTHRRP